MILLQPILRPMVWGGSRLSLYGKGADIQGIGESFDVSCLQGSLSTIQGSDTTLYDHINQHPGILGSATDFSLLIKTIDATQDLSIQVHPSNDYAPNNGKSEMWYILEPPHSGQLVIGLLPNVTKKDLASAIKHNAVMEVVNRVTVQAGDIIDIPPGLVHALTAGTIVTEVQQSSDITYRVYDYGRGRELHIEDALNVIDTTLVATPVKLTGAPVQRVVANRYFDVDLVCGDADVAGCAVLSCVHGAAVLTSGGKTVDVAIGASVFLPHGDVVRVESSNSKFLVSRMV